MVLTPTQDNSQLRILLDGQPVGNQGGADVEDSIVTLDIDRLYHLVDLDQPGRHTLTIEFLDSGIQAFAFTFG